MLKGLKWFSEAASQAAAQVQSAAHQVAESIKPIFKSDLELLDIQWKAVQKDFQLIMQDPLTDLSDPSLLPKSKFGENLKKLLETLLNEEKEQFAINHQQVSDENGQFDNDVYTGPCFEYFLKEKILDSLVALAIPNKPHGMRSVIAEMINSLLIESRHPLLPSMSIHQAVTQFIDVAYLNGDFHNPSTRGPLLSLFETLALKIKSDTELIGIFFDYTDNSSDDKITKEDKNNQNNKNPSEAPNASSAHPESSASTVSTLPQRDKFLLLTGLISLANTEKLSEQRQACNGILALCQVPFPPLANYIIHQTNLIEVLMQGLKNKLHKFIVELLSSSSTKKNSFSKSPNYLQLIERICLIDSICSSSYKLLSHHVASSFIKLIEEDLQPLFIDIKEETCVQATQLMTLIIQNTHSRMLQFAIFYFLCGRDTNPETRSVPNNTSNANEKVPSQSLRTILINRFDSLNEELTSATLDLFSALLDTAQPRIFYGLLTRNLLNLSFVKSEDRNNFLIERSHSIKNVGFAELWKKFQDLTGDILTDKQFSLSLLDAEREGQKWMYTWEKNIAVREVRTKIKLNFNNKINTTLSTNNYKQFDHFDEIALINNNLIDDDCDITEGPKLPDTNMNNNNSDALPPFYSGLFYSALLNKLSNIYESPVPVSLRVTACLSRLAHCPNALIHNFLFDTSSSSANDNKNSTGWISLFNFVLEIWNRGIARSKKLNNFLSRKEACFYRLEKYGPYYVSSSHFTLSDSNQINETKDDELFLSGFIVLESFIKELIAIINFKGNIYPAKAKMKKNQSTSTSSVNNDKDKLKEKDDKKRSSNPITPANPPITNTINSTLAATGTVAVSDKKEKVNGSTTSPESERPRSQSKNNIKSPVQQMTME